ncbi:MAG TPA: tRNA guanosine(34) transglycosylase Tgt [Gammaproteobacteria bacterium]|nr:tRNA guanosine(34) transglycosylase Tgt [Gammaproteobacteria bacterium]
MFRFELIHQSSKSHARVGRIHTPHGVIDTPSFVPVGTHACIKSLTPSQVDNLDIPLMFCNTYHLILHPGTEVVSKLGGLHSMMNRHAPIITDSGGFQVFSLAYGSVANELKSSGKKSSVSSVLKVSEEGVAFRSYRDGERIKLTPESSVQAQKLLGADIIIPLDELPPFHISDKALMSSFDRTHRWQTRSLDEHLKNTQNQAMYAVIHGGVNEKLRVASTQMLANQAFDGMALGGSLGKNTDDLQSILTMVSPHLPPERPRHLLGIGDEKGIRCGVEMGMDTFDSSYPTRAARHGVLLLRSGSIKIIKTAYHSDLSPIEEGCSCQVCTSVTRAYVHHLFKAKELTAYTLATIHNLHVMKLRMFDFRNKILENTI